MKRSPSLTPPSPQGNALQRLIDIADEFVRFLEDRGELGQAHGYAGLLDGQVKTGLGGGRNPEELGECLFLSVIERVRTVTGEVRKRFSASKKRYGREALGNTFLGRFRKAELDLEELILSVEKAERGHYCSGFSLDQMGDALEELVDESVRLVRFGEEVRTRGKEIERERRKIRQKLAWTVFVGTAAALSFLLDRLG
ncbi:MAG: hypothetical protein AAF191_11905 [Verrucomicrobiota bacterium]